MSTRTFPALDLALPATVQAAPCVLAGDPVTQVTVAEAIKDADLIKALHNKQYENVTLDNVVEAQLRASALDVERTNLRYPADFNQPGLPQALVTAMQNAINPIHLQLQQQLQETQQQVQETQQQVQETQQQVQQILQIQQIQLQQLQTQQNLLQEFRLQYSQDQARAFNRQTTAMLRPLPLANAPQGPVGFPPTRTACLALSGASVSALLQAYGQNSQGRMASRRDRFLAFIGICNPMVQE
jgi:CHAT domain-containing protein